MFKGLKSGFKNLVGKAKTGLTNLAQGTSKFSAFQAKPTGGFPAYKDTRLGKTTAAIGGGFKSLATGTSKLSAFPAKPGGGFPSFGETKLGQIAQGKSALSAFKQLVLGQQTKGGALLSGAKNFAKEAFKQGAIGIGAPGVNVFGGQPEAQAEQPEQQVQSQFGETAPVGTEGGADYATPEAAAKGITTALDASGTPTLGDTIKKTHEALKSGGGVAPIDTSAGMAGAGAALKETEAGLLGPTFSAAGQSFIDSAEMGEDEGFDGIQKLQDEFMAQQQTSLVDDYKAMLAESGVKELDTKLMNLGNVIEGSEDDIRTEVEKAGGFATDSQVMALTSVRNKSLIKTYNNLLETRNQQMKYIDTMMGLAKEDKAAANQRFAMQMNFEEKKLAYKQKAQDNAKEAMNNVVRAKGYEGLLAMTGGDPRYIAKAERILGLSSGGLQGLATYQKPLTEMEKLDIDYKRAQINKLAQPDTQVVDENGRKFLINSQTGEIIRAYDDMLGGLASGAISAASATLQDKIGLIDTLSTHKGLKSSVGPTGIFGRGGLTRLSQALSGKRQEFIGGVEQLVSQDTLNKLLDLKKEGGTLGALSDQERIMLASAATKIGTWRKTDKNGNVVGYRVNERAFKTELDRIGNLSKKAYVESGADPSSIGLQQLPDGRWYTVDSNGNYVTFP